jgi:alginate O-acetyltransferase complex protein AlgI
VDSASIQFILFGLGVAVLSNFSCASAWRSTVLLLASVTFLCLLAHSPVLFLPLAGFLLLGYVALVMLQSGWSRHTTWSVLLVILAYAWLKKYTFLPEGIFIRFPYFTLGLSYIFFRVLHLLIDAGSARGTQRVRPDAYLLYLLNFTTFTSGPIQRYDEFARDQFAREPITLGLQMIGLQLERIVRGFFKVNVLAMLLKMMQAGALAQLSQPLPLSIKLIAAFGVATLYPFFLYANFSGYIDIVIALARLLRIRLPENFDRPFSASSFLDFWNRWHITLSTWLKTYVYNPLLLALMRRISTTWFEPFLGVFSFFVTFFLVGVWHGRTSEFLIFGILQGGGVAINKLWQIWLAKRMGRKSYKALASNPIYIAFGRGLTFTWFAFTLFWFWASWRQIDAIFTSLNLRQWCSIWLLVWLTASLLLDVWERFRAVLLSIKFADQPVCTSRYARMVYATTFGLIAFVMTILLNQPAPDIIYKAF